MGGPSISLQKIIDAAHGNQDSLREALLQISQVSQQTQTAAGTTPTSTPAGQANPSAPVPPQATGVVSILDSTYIVQIVNPGATNPVSQIQAQLAKGKATPSTPVQPVRTIYHQIRASTSAAFNVNSNTQVFGGNTGSAQVYWTLSGLGQGRWYVQFRSSYDGINFNTWRNANGGNALGGLINQVTEESAGNSEWILFTLPGALVFGIGVAELVDQEIMGLPTGVYSSGLFGIAGPDGFSAQSNGVCGMGLSDLDIETPDTGLNGVSGIPDFPVEVRMVMNTADNTNTVPSNAAVMAMAFDPTNTNVAILGGTESQPTTWAILKLPGGAKIAIGQGKGLDQSDIWTPPTASWVGTSIAAGLAMSITSLTDAPLNNPPITGFGINQLNGTTLAGAYMKDDGTIIPRGVQTVNWLAIVWQPGTDVTIVDGVPFLKIQLQGGHAVMIGAGQIASGSAVTLPAGYTAAQLLAVATPAGSANSGFHMRGVQQCGFQGLVPSCVYTDNTNTWLGPVNFLMAAWI